MVALLDLCQRKIKRGLEHNTPLIKEDVKKTGKIEVEKTVDMGPQPVIGDTQLLEKKKKISSQQKKKLPFNS